MAPTKEFPPVRACLFDMDGLLIDSEDAYTLVTNQILHENGRPDLPWSIKAQLQGRPNSAASKIFQAWAQLPIPHDVFMKRQVELQAEAFKHCKPLPGVESLLSRLGRACTTERKRADGSSSGEPTSKVRMALATSSHRKNYEIKTAPMTAMFDVFPESQKVVGDDERIPSGRGKPLPDIYLLALQTVNETIRAEGKGEQEVAPEECLVFEDSVPGVEAGRRAGMRVVWVPHPGLLEVYKGREEEVLAGRTGEHKEADLDQTMGQPLPGSPGHVGELQDGWGERLETLETFDDGKYGIKFPDQRNGSDSVQRASTSR